MFYVYLLECADGHYYVGHTDDLEGRLAAHQRGLISGYTSARLPVHLLWSGDAPTREAALAFERQIKDWSRSKKQALVRGEWDALPPLARGRAHRDSSPRSS